jgi:hypothetical protein
MSNFRHLGRVLATAVLSAIAVATAATIPTASASKLPTIVRAGVVLTRQAQLQRMHASTAAALGPSLVQYGGGPVVDGPHTST